MIDVLIVDDHAAVRAGLAAVLRAEPGFRVTGTAADRRSALDAAVARRPDCVMLDYNLGADDGLALCREFSRRTEPPAVVVYSAYADTRLAFAAAAAGASALLDKGGEIEEILDTLRLASRGHRLIEPSPPPSAPRFA